MLGPVHFKGTSALIYFPMKRFWYKDYRILKSLTSWHSDYSVHLFSSRSNRLTACIHYKALSLSEFSQRALALKQCLKRNEGFLFINILLFITFLLLNYCYFTFYLLLCYRWNFRRANIFPAINFHLDFILIAGIRHTHIATLHNFTNSSLSLFQQKKFLSEEHVNWCIFCILFSESCKQWNTYGMETVTICM